MSPATALRAVPRSARRLTASAVCALLIGAPGAAQSLPADSAHVRILAIHDFHGALLPGRYAWAGERAVGGAAALKAHMDSAAARCNCVAIRLDGGDQLQGTLESNLFHGASAVHALNLLGLDAAAIGNHELDWGVDTLRARQAEARYAWLAANIFLAGDTVRPAWARPFTLIERGGLRIAIIGYATAGTPATLRRTTTAPYEFRAGLAGVAAALAATRALAPDFTVVVAHAGGGCPRGACRGEMVDLALALDSGAIDLIVSGHTHEGGVAVVNGIPIVRAGSHGRAVAVIDLVRSRTGRSFRIGVDTTFVDAVTPDASVTAALAPYLERARTYAGTPLALIREPLSARRAVGLGNLVTDALRAAAGADAAFYNSGGLRADVPAGAVTYNDLYRVLPFGNTVVRITLTGRQLRDVIEHSIAGGTDHFSGVHIRYDNTAAPGTRIVSFEIGGEPVADDRTYSFAVSDYHADGGNGFTMLMSMPAERFQLTMLDALIDHLRALPQPVSAPAEARVTPVR